MALRTSEASSSAERVSGFAVGAIDHGRGRVKRKLYVGNLNFSTTEQELRETFAQHGVVTSTKLVLDRMTGNSRGFGFVEFSGDEEAQRAVDALNGTELNGRRLTVNVARPRR
jgi:RNA recognition motif-containing protein